MQSLKAGGLLLHVVFKTGFTVFCEYNSNEAGLTVYSKLSFYGTARNIVKMFVIFEVLYMHITIGRVCQFGDLNTVHCNWYILLSVFTVSTWHHRKYNIFVWKNLF